MSNSGLVKKWTVSSRSEEQNQELNPHYASANDGHECLVVGRRPLQHMSHETRAGEGSQYSIPLPATSINHRQSGSHN